MINVADNVKTLEVDENYKTQFNNYLYINGSQWNFLSEKNRKKSNLSFSNYLTLSKEWKLVFLEIIYHFKKNHFLVRDNLKIF